MHPTVQSTVCWRSLTMAVLQDLLVLLSFGIAAPLLGLVVATSLFARMLRWYHLIAGFLSNQEEQSDGWVDVLAQECRAFFQESHPLHTSRWFLVGFSALFLSFFLVDTAGDAVGIKASLWAPLLLLLLPIGMGLVLERFVVRPLRRSSGSGAAVRRRFSIRLFLRSPSHSFHTREASRPRPHQSLEPQEQHRRPSWKPSVEPATVKPATQLEMPAILRRPSIPAELQSMPATDNPLRPQSRTSLSRNASSRDQRSSISTVSRNSIGHSRDSIPRLSLSATSHQPQPGL